MNRDGPMTPENLARLRELFKAALAQPREARTAFVEGACPDDPALQADLRALLQADAQADAEHFMDAPPIDLDAEPYKPPEQVQQVGPYHLLRMLGQGGMGQVYLARREAPFKHYVALKLLRHGLHNEDILLRFEMERQILASLNHPNIARLLDGGTTRDGLSYLVMEYVDGVPITRFCDAKRLAIPDRLRLFQAICQAVHYAHQNLVVHRDLKPSNILVAENTSGVPQVKLLDFGVAKLLNPSLSSVEVPVTRTMYRLMTPAYAAPEQVRGEPVTTATDVYALGVILYELLSGHPPYRLQHNTPLELEQVICQQEPERPSTKVVRDETVQHVDGSTRTISAAAVGIARGIPTDRLCRRLQGDLDNIVLKALRKEPRRRYGSVEQLARDVTRYLDGRPVEARPSTMGYRVKKYLRRHRVAVLGATIVVLSLLAGIAGTAWQATVATAGWTQARLEAQKATQVTEFLMGLFEASDPSEALGEEITARVLLEGGLARAEELSNQPEVQAQMLDVVGLVYESLGSYDRARPLLERALVLRRRVFGPEHPDVAASLDNVAYLLDNQGQYDEAELLYREALAMRRKLLGPEHLEVAESLNNLAGLLRRRGNYGEADTLAREALAMYRTLLGEEHRLVAESLNNLALVLQDQGDYTRAETLFREALALNRRLLGAENAEVAVNLNNLASLLRRKADYEAAEPFAREALAIRRKIYGDVHPRVAFSLQTLASLLHDKGDLDGAEALYREALAVRRSSFGPEHPRVAESLNGLALLRSQQGAHEDAEALMREALAMQRRLLGAQHPTVAFTLNNLAVVLRRKGDVDEAESLIRESLAMRRTLLGDRHPSVARAAQNLASLLVEQGKYEAAVPFYTEALSIYRERFGEDNPRVQEVYDGFAELYQAWGKPEEAARYPASSPRTEP